MYEFGNISQNIFLENNTNIFSKNSQITEQKIDKSLTKFSKLEQDILSLINYLRKNPLEFCNNLIQKNKHKTNTIQNDIINFLQDIHSKKVLKPFYQISELSLSAKSLLNKIKINYKNNHSLNLKELEPTKKSIRARLSKYGERTGKIFETVLFELDNSEDIVNHILKEEKGRNMLLSNEMKFIGIYCDLIDTNLLCTIIDIVQDFSPFKENKENNNTSNIKNNINNNILVAYNNNIDNNNYNFNKSNYNRLKQNYFYNQNNNYSNINTEYISLTQNLINNKSSKDNLKLKILQRKKPSEIPMHLGIDLNLNDNFNLTNNNINKKTPKKIIQYFDYKNSNGIFSPIQFNLNNINIKKVTAKRINTSNINNIYNEEEKGEYNNLGKINDIKFTMAGRTDLEQQNIIEISKKNMNKSKSVSSFDAVSVNSKNSGKNRFQRLNHDEKMAILHKINNRKIKNSNSKSPNDKNFENNNNIMNDDAYEINNTKKSPSRISSNQEFMDINSDIEKIDMNSNNYTEYFYKATTNNYDNEKNQMKIDIRNLKGDIKMINNEYTNKISEIKNDIKNQLKEEIKKEVREEIKNEFNKQILYEKKQILSPNNYKYEKENNINNKILRNNSNKSISISNTKNGIDNNKNKNNYINKKIYYNKNKGRWSSVGKYYYNKNNKEQNSYKNRIIKNKLYFPDKKNNIYKNNKNIYYKERKSYDWRELTSNNKINNNNDGIILKQKYQERYTKSNYPVNNIFNNNNLLEDNFSDVSSRGTFISNLNQKNGDKSENISFINPMHMPKTKKEIKKLIKIYNKAQDDKRNRNMILNNSSSYNIINNNKSINNCLINDNEINSDIIKIDYNDKNLIQNITEPIIYNNNSYDNTKQIAIKNIIKTNEKKIQKNSNEKEQNSNNENFVEGHRFQIKYEKVKSKSQMYKEIIPKKRNYSMNKIYFKVDENVINNTNNKSFIDDSSSPKSNIFNNNIKSNEDIINKENTNIINQNKVVNEKKEEEIDNKLIKTGRFVDLDFIKNNEEIDEIKNYMDENIYYKETKENPIISKIEKIEGNSVVTTIITKTKKIYTPDEEKSKINLKKNLDNLNDFQYLMNDSKSMNNKKINNYENSFNIKDLSSKMNLENNKDIYKTPSQKKININGNYSNDEENFEKKYIKDPEGNLVETFVKKTKYKNGSVLLEYV